jgi:hypothetical protein
LFTKRVVVDDLVLVLGGWVDSNHWPYSIP